MQRILILGGVWTLTANLLMRKLRAGLTGRGLTVVTQHRNSRVM